MKALQYSAQVIGSPFLKVENGNRVSVKFQDGVISKNGENGLQISEMIMFVYHVINYLNTEFPCEENANTLSALEQAYSFQQKRTADRILRKVEGKELE